MGVQERYEGSALIAVAMVDKYQISTLEPPNFVVSSASVNIGRTTDLVQIPISIYRVQQLSVNFDLDMR